MTIQPWEAKASIARTKRDESVARVEPPLQGLPDTLPLNSQELPKAILTSKEIEITEKYSVTDLLAKLHSRELSAEEVTRAFLRRAALAHFAVSISYDCDNSRAWFSDFPRRTALQSCFGTRRSNELAILTPCQSLSGHSMDYPSLRKNITAPSHQMEPLMPLMLRGSASLKVPYYSMIPSGMLVVSSLLAPLSHRRSCT